MNEDQKIFSLSQKMSKKKFDPTLEEPLKFKQSIVGKYSINHFGSEGLQVFVGGMHSFEYIYDLFMKFKLIINKF